MSSPNTGVEALASNVIVLRGVVFGRQFGLDNPMMIFVLFFICVYSCSFLAVLGLCCCVQAFL